MSKQYRVWIELGYEQLMRYYQGQVSSVIAHTDQGLRLSIPLQSLRQFVDNRGLKGWFVIQTNSANKLQSIQRQSENPS